MVNSTPVGDNHRDSTELREPAGSVAHSVERPPSGGSSFFGEATWALFSTFAQMIADEGELRGLVGPRELERLWSRHLLNSATVLDFVPERASVADVGSGAGFPGVVIAMARPSCQVTLIESMEKRCEWLTYVSRALDLKNVTIVNGRAEEMPKNSHFDIVTARAVAPLKKLIPWTLPLVKPQGKVAALKGARVYSEIDDATQQLRQYGAAWADVHEVETFGTHEETWILEIAKK